MLPLDYEGSPHSFRVNGEETNVSLKREGQSGVRARDHRLFEQAALSAAPGQLNSNPRWNPQLLLRIAFEVRLTRGRVLIEIWHVAQSPRTTGVQPVLTGAAVETAAPPCKDKQQ